jgi:hypothetical protein
MGTWHSRSLAMKILLGREVKKNSREKRKASEVFKYNILKQHWGRGVMMMMLDYDTKETCGA